MLLFLACNDEDVYNQKAKTLDSLSGVVNLVVKELKKSDTVLLQKAITRFSHYKQFIELNVNDTISKNEGDNLKHFYSAGKSLENFLDNRLALLTRASIMNAQLIHLTNDTKQKAIEIEQLSAYVVREKTEINAFIELTSQQQKIVYSALEEFKSSLNGVEQLIKSRNNGELPTIVKDNSLGQLDN